MGRHVWEIDRGEVANPMRPSHMVVERCRTCNCLKITDTSTGKIVYKPFEFTWNPLKTLKAEPTCPAKW